MTIERFQPDEIIELRDAVMGGLKLGLVDDTGIAYYDIHADNEVPKPIHAELEPRSLGPVESWFGDLDPAFAEALTQTWVELTNRNCDVLTIARALRAGIEQHSTVVELLEQAALDATSRVRDGRKAIAAALPRE